jgi:hypothetical protein
VNEDYSRESSVTSMLKELKWPTLQQRRTNTKMVMMYRIVVHSPTRRHVIKNKNVRFTAKTMM